MSKVDGRITDEALSFCYADNQNKGKRKMWVK
jgi:hypothetical protein